jgi:hypothetical protein
LWEGGGPAEQLAEDPQRLNDPIALVDGLLGPAGAPRAELADPFEPPGRAPLDPADLLRGDVRRLRAEPPLVVPGR